MGGRGNMQISLGDRRAAAAAKTHLKFRGLSPAIKLKKKGKIRNTYSRLRVSTSLMQILFHDPLPTESESVCECFWRHTRLTRITPLCWPKTKLKNLSWRRRPCRVQPSVHNPDPTLHSLLKRQRSVETKDHISLIISPETVQVRLPVLPSIFYSQF